jgi:hypothetical protein
LSKAQVQIQVKPLGCNLNSCTVAHERLHASQIQSCCGQARVLVWAASTDSERQNLANVWNQWVTANTKFMECRAHTVSYKCALNLYRKLTRGGAVVALVVTRFPSTYCWATICASRHVRGRPQR